MNPYRFAWECIKMILEAVLYGVVGILGAIFFSLLFLFDRFVRNGRYKSWYK